jgi:alpha,alpha-trehalase
VKSLDNKPGILALAMNEVDDGQGGKTLRDNPFTVPGARFNEVRKLVPFPHGLSNSSALVVQLGPSFISLGLLVSGQVNIAKGMVDHSIFEIKHYGKILNGNRSTTCAELNPPSSPTT